MVLKRGRYGTFLACSGYPDCKNTKKIVQGKNGEKAVKKEVIETDEICEKVRGQSWLFGKDAMANSIPVPIILNVNL